MKKVLAVVTNMQHYGKHDKLTGLWLSELTHFWQVMEPAGIGIDLASPKGGYIHIDPRSLKFPFMDRYTRQKKSDPQFMDLLEDTPSLTEIEPADYQAIYYVGGHGTMWDFPDDPNSISLCQQFYEDGKIISAVCHGVCALLNVRKSDGSYLIDGQNLTGYSWLEEQLANVTKWIPFNLEKEIAERGATYQKAKFPFKSFVQVSDRIVTGQNPQSAKDTGRATLKLLQ